jgi:hypothetical protein
MGVTFVTLDQAHRHVMHRHLRDTRKSEWPDAQLAEYIEWRYFRRREGETLLAVSKDRCVAMIDSVIRAYADGGGRVNVREPAEWFCLPEFRPLGLGLQVLKRMMGRPEPIIAVRGTPDTQALLPRLGWERLPDVVLLNAVINWRRRLQEVKTRFFRLAPAAARDQDLHVTFTPPNQQDLDAVAASARAFTPLLSAWEVEWFTSAPHGVGEYLWVRLERGGVCQGYGLGRAYRSTTKLRGKVIHVAAVSPAVLPPLIEALMGQFRHRSIDHIAARASDANTVASYSRCGFAAGRATQPVYWWKGTRDSISPVTLDLSYLRGDDSIRPLSLALEA